MRGKIASQKGPVTFVIELDSGGQCQRHQDHLRKRSDEEEASSLSGTGDEDIVTVWPAAESAEDGSEPGEGGGSTEHEQPECEPDVVGEETRRYPRHAPDRLGH